MLGAESAANVRAGSDEFCGWDWMSEIAGALSALNL